MNHEIVVLYVAWLWYSQLQVVFSSPMFVIQGYQKSYILGLFWVLCLSNCAVMHSFWIKSNTNYLLVIVVAKCQRVQNDMRLHQ